MNRKVKNLLRQKEIAWQRYRGRKLPTRRQVYNVIRNNATFECKKAKKEFEREIALDTEEDTKHFWSHARSKTKFKEQVSRVQREKKSLRTTDQETAKVMNGAFSSVFIREAPGEDIPETESIYQGPELMEIDFSPDHVLKHLKKLKPNKACGPDGVSPIVLTKCAETLHMSLFEIFIFSVRENDIPIDWRSAVIPPIFKKGSKTNAKNYKTHLDSDQCCG